MKSRVAAILCPDCQRYLPIRADRLPLPILGLSVEVRIDASDGYEVSVHDHISEPSRHAREILPHRTCTPQKIGETINRLLLVISEMKT